jgi:uncharacterized repeat protein (TIGR01451 family)
MKKKSFLVAFAVLLCGIGVFHFSSSSSISSNNLQASVSGSAHKIPEYMPNEVVVTFSADYLNSLNSVMTANSTDSANTIQSSVENYIFEKLGTTAVDVEAEVLFDNDLSEEQKERIRREKGASQIATTASLQPQKMLFVQIKSINKTTEELLADLADDPNISASQPNYIYSIPTPNSTNQMNIQANESFENNTDLWNIFNNVDGAGVDADKVWEKGFTGQGVVVAVVDTGVDTDHADLVNNIWRNEGETNCNNGIDDDSNGYVDDCFGWDFGDHDNSVIPDPTFSGGYHGSHVAGIIAAEHDESGIVGVAPDAKIMPVKAFPDGGYAQTTTVVNAIQYAWQNNADVISVSIGREDACSTIESNAIAMAMNAGALVITSSGNADPANGLDIPFSNAPAVCDDSIAVGATDIDKSLPAYSNYFNDMVDVVAPGGGSSNMILSADPNGGYMGSSGTSMATPHISGIAALLFSKNPFYTPQDIRSLLCSGSDDLGDPGKDSEYGCGFSNANNIFSLTEENAPEISNVFWNPELINSDTTSETSSLVFSVCDSDDNLEGGNIRVWNAGTKTSFIGGSLDWTTLPDASNCFNPLQYSIPVDFTDLAAGDYCIDLEVSDALGNVSNTLSNVCITREDTNENLSVTPLLQDVLTGQTVQTITAQGAESYTFVLDAGNTGITKQNCNNGDTGSCSLSSATGTGTAKLTINGLSSSQVATIHTRDVSAPEGDFELYVTANRRYPEIGDTVIFTIHYANNGTKNYTNVRITDKYDSGAILLTSVPPNCNYTSSLISCDIGALAPGDAGELNLVAVIKE